jgi:hypothetical protein
MRTLKSKLLLSVAPEIEGLVNPVVNKIDALLTLTELSLLADKAVLQFGISVVSISIIYQFVRQVTDLARFLQIGGSGLLEEAVRNTKEPVVPYRSVNPATGEALKIFTEHTDEQMWNALATADKALQAWAARPFRERSKIIGKSVSPVPRGRERHWHASRRSQIDVPEEWNRSSSHRESSACAFSHQIRMLLFPFALMQHPIARPITWPTAHQPPCVTT